MKVILIDGFYLGKGRGIANYIENVLSAINDMEIPDIRIVVACTRDASDKFYSDGAVHLLRLPKVPFPLWENLVLPLVSVLVRPDIFHFPANSSSFLPVVGRRVVTVHDTIFMQKNDVVPTSQVLRQRLGRWYLSWNARLLAKKYTSILTVSNFSKSDIIKHMKVSSDIVTVSSEGPGLVFNKSKIPLLHRRNIIHFASKDPRKNTERVIHAFCESRALNLGFTLHLVGFEGNEYFIPHDVRHAVKLHSFLSFDELQRLVDNTFLLLYPSLYEGFGMPIVEFQKVGIPVITSNSSACAEVGSAGCVLVDPLDISMMARNIDLLCTDNKFTAELSVLAEENASKYQWVSCANEVLATYEKA